jgi:hypothetical protein
MASQGARDGDKSPYISLGSDSVWPGDLPTPRTLVPRTHKLAPHQHLDLVCSIERTGIVGDVIFDLRHPQLDPTRWIAESLGRSERDRRRYSNRPFLWFPWYGEYPPDWAKSCVTRVTKHRIISRAKKVALEKEFLPEYIVNRGDKISLDQAEILVKTTHKERDTLRDEPIKLAILTITRSDGTIKEIDTPLRFFPRSALYNNTRADIVAKTIRNIIDKAANSLEVNRIALEADIIASLINSETRGQATDLSLENLIGLSITLGRLWAKAEAATEAEPMAELAERSHQKSRDGGVRSGEIRRNAPWRQIALPEIKAIREENPNYSQDRVAEHVAGGWKNEKIQNPTHKTLKIYISKLEKEGIILRRQKGAKKGL